MCGLREVLAVRQGRPADCGPLPAAGDACSVLPALTQRNEVVERAALRRELDLADELHLDAAVLHTLGCQRREPHLGRGVCVGERVCVCVSVSVGGCMHGAYDAPTAAHARSAVSL